MFGSALIIFRETLEAALVLGIIAAATRGVSGRGLWLTTGVAAGLLGAHDPAVAAMSFEHEPITTCYLHYPSAVKLAIPFYALIDDVQAGQWGQFVFDRGQLDAAQAGLLAVVVSASTEASALDHAELVAAISVQLAETLQRPELRQPLWSKVITEKRATFACTPGLMRPANQTALPGLWLAGDYTDGDYPATIEGAVRSGLRAAREMG